MCPSISINWGDARASHFIELPTEKVAPLFLAQAPSEH